MTDGGVARHTPPQQPLGRRGRGIVLPSAHPVIMRRMLPRDDIVPPRIRISADGQMAYVVVQKRVHLTQPGPGGTTLAERVRYAWLSVYEKRDGRWTLTAIASTERPDSL